MVLPSSINIEHDSMPTRYINDRDGYIVRYIIK